MNTLVPGGNGPLNQWVDENLLAVGIALVCIGSLMALVGFRGVRRGAIADRNGLLWLGRLIRGLSLVRMLAGIALVAFGLYKLVSG
jgi:hypothetical protein